MNSSVTIHLVAGQTSAFRAFTRSADALAFIEAIERYNETRPRKYDHAVAEPHNPGNKTISQEYNKWLENHPDPEFASALTLVGPSEVLLETGS